LLWKDGSILLANSTITIAKLSTLNVQGGVDVSSLALLSDGSQSNFDAFASSVLNTAVDLKNILPIGKGLYDLNIDRAIYVLTSSVANEIQFWALSLSKDPFAAHYYGNAVPNVTYGYGKTMYFSQLQNIDADKCAQQCTAVFPSGCASFDYYFYSQTCHLSQFKRAQVGGLTKKAGVTGSVSHFEKRTVGRPIDSVLVVNGILLLHSQNNIKQNMTLDVEIDVQINGIAYIKSRSNAVFSSNVKFNSSALVNLASTASIKFKGESSSLNMLSGSVISNSISSLPDNGSSSSWGLLSFHQGTHQLHGSWHHSLTLIAGSNATVSVALSEVKLHTLKVVDNATVFFTLQNSTSLNCDSTYLSSGGKILSRVLYLNATNSIFVGNSSTISTSGYGFKYGTGPASGSSYPIGGSGGSHGGVGGPGKVDSITSKNVSLFFPRGFQKERATPITSRECLDETFKRNSLNLCSPFTL
jgi:hypothetical protein